MIAGHRTNGGPTSLVVGEMGGSRQVSHTSQHQQVVGGQHQQVDDGLDDVSEGDVINQFPLQLCV